jgi:tRNA threonylcarbamoyladenosine biosynthesis protein TsaB
MIVAIRTDQPEAEVGIFNSEGNGISKHKWHAHRTLSSDLLRVIREQLAQADASWNDIDGLIIFAGPGSFTGLRIGAAVANTIAHENQAPIVGTTGESWISDGIRRLKNNENDKVVLPEYGSAPNITKPRK